MNVFLIRHTAVYNPKKLCYGQSEIALEENFTSEFNWLEDILHPHILNDALFYSSPLRRCTKLASYLSNENYLVDDRILELNFGDWELKEWDDIIPKDLDEWMSDFVHYTIPNGESFMNLYNRVNVFWQEILKLEKSNIFIVSHAGVIRSILASILEFPLEKAFDIAIDYQSITQIKYDAKTKRAIVSAINMKQKMS